MAEKKSDECPKCHQEEDVKVVCKHCGYNYPDKNFKVFYSDNSDDEDEDDDESVSGCLSAFLGTFVAVFIVWLGISFFIWILGSVDGMTFAKFLGNQFIFLINIYKRLW